MRLADARRWAALVGLPSMLVLLAACGEAPQPRAAAEEPVAEVRLIDSQPSQPSIPSVVGFAFADIVTEGEELDAVWRRFGLTGQPPEVDVERSALLFAGFGESGTCPARFDGVDVRENVLNLRIGSEGGPACTADSRPRTFVVAVDRAELPPGGFTLMLEGSHFPLAGSPQPGPPPAPDILFATDETPVVSLVAEPSTVAAGDPVEVVIDNDGPLTVNGLSWQVALDRWDDQRWLPAADQRHDQAHPAFSAATHVTAEPTQRVTAGTVDTADLEPGWYGLRTQLSLSGSGGLVEVRAEFEVTG